MNTPWGRADSQRVFAEGITFYSTPSHGGFHVSSDRLSKIPSALQGLSGYPVNWYEEDCSWAAVAYAHPEAFVIEDGRDSDFKNAASVKEYAREVLQRWYPSELARAEAT